MFDERFAIRSQERLPSQGDGESLPARAVTVGGTKFDFGTMRRNETREHTFVITNEGDDLLRHRVPDAQLR